MTINVYGVTFELVSDLAIKVFTAKADVEKYALDAFKDYSSAKYPHEVSELMEEVEYARPSDAIYQWKEIIEDMYWELDYIEDKAYRNRYMDDFLEYQSHMDEPDFDWDFYSDWHKDMYGFRPH